MIPSRVLQLTMWRARLVLRRSSFLRQLVRRLRAHRPAPREHHLRAELRFWKRWLVSEGLQWPEDFAYRFDPAAPVEDYLAELIDSVPKQKIDILDVGAGPVTAIGKVHSSKQLAITPTDALAHEYDRILARSGRKPPVPTVYAEAEKLREQLGRRRFDIVHARNSLDHSADPLAGLEEMFALTRPGGFIVLLHEENEGRNELYQALHQWDFTCDAGHFVIAGPGPNGARRNVTDMMAGRAEVDCSVTGGLVLVVMRKLGAGPRQP